MAAAFTISSQMSSGCLILSRHCFLNRQVGLDEGIDEFGFERVTVGEQGGREGDGEYGGEDSLFLRIHVGHVWVWVEQWEMEDGFELLLTLKTRTTPETLKLRQNNREKNQYAACQRGDGGTFSLENQGPSHPQHGG